MLVQAVGTGASAGAAVVSESDMSVVLLCGVKSACRVRQTPMDPKTKRDRERGRDRRVDSEVVKGEGTQQEVGGDKHVRAEHMCVRGSQRGSRVGTWVKASDLGCSTKAQATGQKRGGTE